MGASIWVASDGSWGSGEPGEFVVLHGISSHGIIKLDEATDAERWELAQTWAIEQEQEDN